MRCLHIALILLLALSLLGAGSKKQHGASTHNAVVTFENLDANGDVGSGADQVCEGDKVFTLAENEIVAGDTTFAGDTDFGNIIVEGSHDLGTFQTFTIDDATPSIAGGKLWKFHASHDAGVHIEGFDGGVEGDEIIVRTAAVGGITYEVGITLIPGDVDLVAAPASTTRWINVGFDTWLLLEYNDHSIDNTTGATVTYENLDANSDIGFGATQVPQGSLAAPLDDPDFTSTPTAPTAAADTDTTQIATTAYVQTELAGENHLGDDLTSSGITISTTHANARMIIGEDGGAAFKYDFDAVANQVEVSSAGTGINAFNFGSLKLITTGGISAGHTVVTRTTTPYQPGFVTNYRVYFTYAGASVMDLPTGTQGDNFCAMQMVAYTLEIDPESTDGIWLDGTLHPDGEHIISSGAAGEFMCMSADGNGDWATWERGGTWTEETP